VLGIFISSFSPEPHADINNAAKTKTNNLL